MNSKLPQKNKTKQSAKQVKTKQPAKQVKTKQPAKQAEAEIIAALDDELDGDVFDDVPPLPPP